MKRIILDTDTGVDDALAILLAMRSPELRVEAITGVGGNAPLDCVMSNIRRVLGLLSRKDLPPVARGEAVPLMHPLTVAHEVHGWDGLGGVTELLRPDGSPRYPEAPLPLHSLPAVDLILDLIASYPDEITLVTVGPLTNIARAVLKDRRRMLRLREIVTMGGAFHRYSNTQIHSEFNVFADPYAARIVLNLGVPLTLVPLDATEQVILTRPAVDAALQESDSPLLEFVRDVTAFYMQAHLVQDGFEGSYLHDPLAVGVAIRPDFVRTVESLVEVETRGRLTFGMTVADLRPEGRWRRPGHVRVAADANAGDFLQFFLSRLKGDP